MSASVGDGERPDNGRSRSLISLGFDVLVAVGAFAAAGILTGTKIAPTFAAVVFSIIFPGVILAFMTAGFEYLHGRMARPAPRALFTLVGAVAATGLLIALSRAIDFAWTPLSATLASALFLAIRPIARARRGAEIGTVARSRKPHAKRTLVVGSKDAAAALIRLIAARDDLPFDVVGCIDDSPVRKSVEGVAVVGAVDRIAEIIKRFEAECVIIAATNVSRERVRDINDLCSGVSAPDGGRIVVKVLPEVAEMLMGTIQVGRLRDVSLEDLLRRKRVTIDARLAAPHLRNQIVLVTGAGGSIGSELCRQIAAFEPKLLLLLGHGENSLFAIDQELRSSLGFTQTRIIVADVADVARVRRTFARFRPHIVFHAAAHKHVPIVEDNVCEAVRNNVLGTQVLALAAAASGVAKFVMISTDKAVNPSSMMGATKRAAELICQSFEGRTGTEFVSVRFGNVLGSRGSVINTFKRQLESGSPITVTHPDMVRYFMTIPEAVTLVLEAMAIGRDGQVFVMDMGEPVRVVELAENLIRLSGLRPYEDVDIVFTGIRPGEKLFEEMLTARERENPTINERLFMAQQERIEYDRLSDTIGRLDLAVRTPDPETVVKLMSALVPSYTPSPHLIGERNGVATQIAASSPAAGNGAVHSALPNIDGAASKAADLAGAADAGA
ncbi:MAG TPA: nucleoside-diphosphate sugar epimerase/dehydratase [Candidatus Eremiobacteraceae bacterium]|nr:nucleoside-diphosphate sugar epimerase/dehydratase [Candidatus Eremiobacteraceae bacterium]